MHLNPRCYKNKLHSKIQFALCDIFHLDSEKDAFQQIKYRCKCGESVMWIQIRQQCPWSCLFFFIFFWLAKAGYNSLLDDLKSEE